MKSNLAHSNSHTSISGDMRGHTQKARTVLTLHMWHGALWTAVVWNKWNSNFTLCMSKNTSSPLNTDSIKKHKGYCYRLLQEYQQNMIKVTYFPGQDHYYSNSMCSIHLVQWFIYLPAHAADILVAICDLTCFS